MVWFYFDNFLNYTANDTSQEKPDRSLFNSFKQHSSLPLGERCFVELQTPGQLTINETRIEDAGIYRCLQAHTTLRLESILIVLGNVLNM